MRNQKRMKGTKLQKLLEEIIEQHDRFKSSYFWSPPGNASGRRSYERQNSRKPVAFLFRDKLYRITQDVSCSCKNVYYNFSVTEDDKNKDIRILKKLAAA